VSVLLLCLTLLLTPRHVLRVVDGDTVVLASFGVVAEERIRVLDVDTPERGESLYVEAGRFTAAWLAQGVFSIETCRKDSFGRYLAVVHRGSDTLAVALIRAGLGRPYVP
jgi:micrococcal nuclease